MASTVEVYHWTDPRWGEEVPLEKVEPENDSDCEEPPATFWGQCVEGVSQVFSLKSAPDMNEVEVPPLTLLDEMATFNLNPALFHGPPLPAYRGDRERKRRSRITRPAKKMFFTDKGSLQQAYELILPLETAKEEAVVNKRN